MHIATERQVFRPKRKFSIDNMDYAIILSNE